MNIFNKSEFICLHTVKWFQVLLANTNNSIQHFSFVCTQLNGFKYCYIIEIQFNICHLFAQSCSWHILLLQPIGLTDYGKHSYITSDHIDK